MTHDIAKIDNYSVYRRFGNNAQQFMKEMVKKYFGLLKIQVKFLIF